MENNGASSSSSTFNRDCPQQSQWLQQTLSDFNRRMREMMSLLKEDENSTVKIEIYQANGLQLFQMLDEFRESYCSLAETCDQLRSNDATDLRSPPSFSNSNKLKSFERRLDSIMEDPNVRCDNSNFDFKYLNTLVEELMSTNICDTKRNARKNQCKEKATDVPRDDLLKDQDTVRDPREDSFEGDSWSKLNFHVSELMLENFHQLAELARRNIEKRVMINRLQLQLENLTYENRALQSYMSRLKVQEKHNRFQIPKLKRLVSSKLFRLGS